MTSQVKKIIKVSKTTAETRQLEVFINSLGVVDKPAIYMYDLLAFIGIDIILPILSVDKEWFLKNSEKYVHYIKVRGQVYVNKYGLTKLLAQSREAVAFKLQDYIYEVIMKLETKGVVSKNEVATREELMSTLAELNIYKSIEIHNNTINQELQDRLNAIQNDYTMLELNNKKLETDYKSLQIKVDMMEKTILAEKEINKELVKVVAKQYPEEKYTRLIEKIYDKYIDADEVSKPPEYEDVIMAPPKQRIARNSRKLGSNGNRVYYLMRSVDFIIDDRSEDPYTYVWSLSDDSSIENAVTINNVDYDNYKEYSKMVRLGDIPKSISHTEIWFNDIELNDRQYRLLNYLIKQLNNISETMLSKIIEIIL